MSNPLRTGPLTKFLGESLDGIDARGETICIAEDLIPSQLIERIATEASSIPDIFLRKHANWVLGRRATFFTQPSSEAKQFKRILARGFSSQSWTPYSHSFAINFAQLIRDEALSRVAHPSLHAWEPNRLGFNYLFGSPKSPARIPQHTDPVREVGLVATLSLLGDDPGRLSLIFCHDVCSSAGLPQPSHGITATRTRVSLTLAQLTSLSPSSQPSP